MRFFLLILLVFKCFVVIAQQQVCFWFEPKNQLKNFSNKCTEIDSLKHQTDLLEREILQLQMLGFFNPKIEKNQLKDSINYIINTGKRFEVFYINNDEETQQIFTDAGLRALKKSYFNMSLLEQKVKTMLNYLQNNGYPFATVYFDSVVVGNDTVFLKIKTDKGNLIVFDSIGFAGNANVKTQFLQKYLNIKPGTGYSELLVSTSTQKLSALPFVQVYALPAVYFYGNKAKPYLYLNNKNANVFNATIGFAPNSSINNRLVLTGEANLQLQNIAGNGKSFAFNYRNFLSGSQDIDLNFNWPYFLQSNIGIDYVFKILRFDSLFTDITNHIGFQYLYSANKVLKVFFEQQNVFTIYADTNFVKLQKRLPLYNDVLNRFYGISFKFNQLNYLPNPSSGYLINFQTAIGSRQIIKNTNIKNVLLLNDNQQPYSIYDSVKLQSVQFKASGNLSYYHKIYKHIVWHNQLMFGFVNTQNLFINDLYRIGGYRTLRGFDEQSIFANNFGIINSELRYLFTLNSNFMIFYNKAMFTNPSTLLQQLQSADGLGLGLNLQSGTGVFSIFYAVGKQNNNPINFNSAKIHFGYINYF